MRGKPLPPTWKAPDNVEWLSLKLILNDARGRKERLAWERAHPDDPWPYPRLFWPALKRRQFEVESCRHPPEPDRVRMIRIVYGRQEATYYHPDDLRAVEGARPHGSGAPFISEGSWIGDEAYRLSDGRLAVTVLYLESEFKGPDKQPLIRSSQWYEWIHTPCRDLDHATNGGRILAWSVRRDESDQRVTVYLLDQAEEIIRRRSTENRTELPSGAAYLDSKGDIVRHPDFGICYSNASVAEKLKRSLAWVSRRQRRSHPALCREVNGARPRSFRAWPLVPVPGSKRRRLTCFDDLLKIAKWEKELARRGTLLDNPALADESLLDRKGLAQHFGFSDSTELRALSVALFHFATERPDKCTRQYARRSSQGDGRRGSIYWKWLYSVEAFSAWLGGRDIIQLARQLLKEHRGPRLAKAILFLHFALTTDYFSIVRFNRFLAAPPTGTKLSPRQDAVAVATLKEWAASVGVSWNFARRAKLDLASRGVKIAVSKGAGPTGRRSWRLVAPVQLCLPERQLNAVRRLEKRRGRPAAKGSGLVGAYCYERYINGDKLAQIRAGAKEKFGAKLAPKNDGHVTYNAQQYAKANGLACNRPSKTSKTL